MTRDRSRLADFAHDVAASVAGTWPLAARFLLAAALAVTFFVAYFSPVLFGGKILAPGDGYLQNYPSFRDGRSLWNPDLFSGYPAFADPQAARWYPIQILFAATGSFNLFAISAYILASLFAFLLGARLTGSRTAGVLAGLVYGTGGFFMSHLGHSNMIHAAAWLPLHLLALYELGEQPKLSWFLVAGGSIAFSVLAGHPQSVVLSLLVAGAFSIFTALAVSRMPLRFLGLAAASLLAGLGLAAVALVPMMELSSLSVRSTLPFKEFVEFSLPLRQLPALLFPALFGGMPSPLYPLPYLGAWNLSEVTAWVGVTTLLLAGFAIVLPGRRREATFWMAIGAAAITFALGPEGPASSLLYHVPVLNKFRAQGRHALEFTMAASILAAYGLAALERLESRKRVRAIILGTALAGTVLLAVPWGLGSARVLESMAKGVAGTKSISLSLLRNSAVGVPIGLFVLTTAALLLWAARPSRASAIVLAVAFAVELAQYGWFFEWRFDSPTRIEIERPAALDRFASELSETHQRLFPLAGTGQAGGPIPNLSSLWHLPSASGYSPLMLRRYREFLGIQFWGALIPGRLVPTNLAFDLLAIRWAFVPGSPRTSATEENLLEFAPLDSPRGMKWSPAGAIGASTIYENATARPRAWLVHETTVQVDEEILRSVVTAELGDGRSFDPLRLAILERPLAEPVGPEDPGASATVRTLGRDAVDIETRSASPSLLVLADVFYPGWEATVDGRRTQVVRADYVLRAAPVAAGRHVVRFEFRPASLRTGAAISGATFLLLAVAGVWLVARRQGPGGRRSGG